MDLYRTILHDSNQDISVRKAGIYRFPQTYYFRPHAHIETEINYVNSGSSLMIFGNKQIPLSQGDCILVPPYVNHGFLVNFKKGCELTQVEAELKVPPELEAYFKERMQGNPYQVIKNCEDLVSIMEQVGRFNRSDKNDYTKTMLNFSIIQLLIAFMFHMDKAEAEKRPFAQNPQLDALLKYIHNNYTEKINLELLAQKAGLSSRYVRKYFAQTLHMSCTDYISNLRIDRAKQLLRETDKDITAIAMECGYSSVQYFCSKFKNETGMTPGQFRQKW
jgi:AraC-like DNA-binding protein/mannose-6-phosphate isomerase-like protein (cupin superfamily)